MQENKNKNSSPPDFEELADILVAISVIAKRLSKQIMQDNQENGTKEREPNGS